MWTYSGIQVSTAIFESLLSVQVALSCLFQFPQFTECVSQVTETAALSPTATQRPYQDSRRNIMSKINRSGFAVTFRTMLHFITVVQLNIFITHEHKQRTNK